MDEESTFDLADYADLMYQDYVPKESCKCDFYFEYVSEGEFSPLSTQPVVTKTSLLPQEF